jgi:hypothetical protein
MEDCHAGGEAMNIFDMLSNTVEGIAEVAVNTVKAPIGVVILPLDGGATVVDAASGVSDGLKKIGKATK